jgi:hypothetical protein
MPATLSPAPPVPPNNEVPINADTGGHTKAWRDYHQAMSDAVAAATTGVTDGSDATAGAPGEYMTATSGGVSLTNNTNATVATLNLTAGDWDVSGSVSFSAGAGTHTSFGAGLDTIIILNQSSFPTGAITQGIGVPRKRYNVSAATAVHLVAVATFSSGTVTVQGTASARRMR